MFSCIIVFPIVVRRFNPLRLETFYADQCREKILKFIDESDDQDKSKLDRQLDDDYKKMEINQIEAAAEEAEKMFVAKQQQAEKTGEQDKKRLARFRSFKCLKECGVKETNVCSCERFPNEDRLVTAGKKLLKFYRMTKTRNMFMDMRSLKQKGRQLKQAMRQGRHVWQTADVCQIQPHLSSRRGSPSKAPVWRTRTTLQPYRASLHDSAAAKSR